jgi:uncharacterized protein (TIGR02266 family)
MDKRFTNRIFTRVRALFGPQAPDHIGFALNMSAEGLFLSGARLFPPSTRLHFRLEPIGIAPLSLAGTVRWGMRVPPSLLSVVKPGMGVALDAPPAAYLDYFAGLARLNAKRAHPRVGAHLEVRFYDREGFVKEYTENICRGGLYIVTDKVFAIGATIAVELVVPGLAASWPVTGRVAYVLDEDQARALDTSRGIGVQITAIEPQAEEAFRAYVQRIMRLYEAGGGKAGPAAGGHPG